MRKMIVLFVLSLSVAALSGCGKKEKPAVDTATPDATKIVKEAKTTADATVKDAKATATTAVKDAKAKADDAAPKK